MPTLEPVVNDLEILINAIQNSPGAARMIIANAPSDYIGDDSWAASVDVDGFEYVQNGPTLKYVVSELTRRYQEDVR